MKTTRSREFKYHHFWYGPPGSGKTEAYSSFPGLCIVGPKSHDGTLSSSNVDAVFLQPETEDELRIIVEAPDYVVDKIAKSHDGYKVQTFVFDTLKDLQAICLGHERLNAIKDDDKEIIPLRAASGAMRRSGNRNASNIGNELDYRIVDNNMRALLTSIDDMPYHTIVTAHADTIGKKKGKGEGQADWNTWWPAIEGWALKRDLPGLLGDFCLGFEQKGSKFLCHPNETPDYFARNRWHKKGFTETFEWTNKSMWSILEEHRRRIQSG